MVPADIYRPAAIQQLQKLGNQIGTVLMCHARNEKDGSPYWDVEADVEDKVVEEMCQLMEPTFPVT